MQDLPIIYEEIKEQYLVAMTASVKETSKFVTIGLFLLNWFVKMYLNSILSFIRTISVIAHLLSIEIAFPDAMEYFYSALFELQHNL